MKITPDQWLRTASLSLFALLPACSEAADTTDVAGSTTVATAAASTGAQMGTTSSSATTSASGTGGGGSGLVLNEVSGVGDDYVELFNASPNVADLGGLKLADDDAGSPKLTEAVVFPAGTTLPPGAYLFVVADLATAAPGPQTSCDPGPSPCFQATFGISKSGDVLYLLDASDGILESVAFPSAVSDGQTWGRLPNGSGAFVPTKPTPGTVNEAP